MAGRGFRHLRRSRNRNWFRPGDFRGSFVLPFLANSGIRQCLKIMPRETNEAKAARVKKIIAGLQKTYPDAHCELHYSNPLELLIATILSAQCTDKRVNIVTAELFKKYRSAEDYAAAPISDLESAIKTTGFFRNKTKSIKTACRNIVEKHGGKVPRTMEELVTLGGVGRKTANVVLGNAF